MNVINFLLSAISLGTTFIYGATGEILTEKVGHLNLGIPGVMCVGGASGCIAISMMYKTGMPPILVLIIAILATFLGGAVMGLLYSFLTVTLHANQNVTGLAMTTFGVGLMKYMMSGLKPVSYLYAVPYFRFPFADMKNSLQYCGVMMLLGFGIAIAASIVLNRTRLGLHLRAVGENPATADAVGINVTAYKYGATCIGSGIAGIGGIFYMLTYSGSQEASLSVEALGWLAIALVIFTLWKPYLTILGASLFGTLFVAGSFIPSLGITLDMSATPLLKMLPYVVTVIVLIVTSIRNRGTNQPPASLGTNYFREER